MSLLEPNAGLVFWMLLAFGIVFFLLAKFAWPTIIGAADKRSDFIADSIKSAEEANKKLADVKIEAENIIAEAMSKKSQIMQETSASRDKIINDAKQKAEEEAEKIVADARVSMQREHEEVMSQYRSEVASMAIDIAEKLLRRELSTDKEQQALINSMLDELKK